MWKPGIRFRLRGFESRCPSGKCADAEALFQIKTRRLLGALLPWAEGLVRSGSVRSGLIFADHGQDFVLPPDGEVHTAGYHGWYMTSDVLRVPLIPFGASRFSGSGSATSWLEVGSAVERIIRGESNALDIRRIATERTVRSHFIRPALAVASDPGSDPAILTSERITRGIDFATQGGWSLTPSPAWSNAPMSRATVIGDELRIENPEGGRSYAGYDGRHVAITVTYAARRVRRRTARIALSRVSSRRAQPPCVDIRHR